MKIRNVFVFVSIFFLSIHPCRAEEMIRYAALGDSYTIGFGALPQESWPALLTARLKIKGFPIELVGNLGRSGWTTKDVIAVELPEFRKLNANFATLLIGTNDWVQGVPAEDFQKRLCGIIDQLLKELPNKDHLIVMTIPDFSITPNGKSYVSERDIAKGISEFNNVIRKECARRSILTVDLFLLTQRLAADTALFSSDGIHPSASGYAQWEGLIEPSAIQALRAAGLKIKGEL